MIEKEKYEIDYTLIHYTRAMEKKTKCIGAFKGYIDLSFKLAKTQLKELEKGRHWLSKAELQKVLRRSMPY